MAQLPQLLFSNLPLRELVQKIIQPKTLIITDSYNYPYIQDLATTYLIHDQDVHFIDVIQNTYTYSKVIAIGGCTALDFGRAIATGKELIAIPTILSNSCISVNRSVIKYEDGYRSKETCAPCKTIVSLHSILHGPRYSIIKWSQSGFGDLFANISASVEYEYQKRGNSFDTMTTPDALKNVFDAAHALQWVCTTFDGYTQVSLKRLAKFLHRSSLQVITSGSIKFSAASEHKLYYQMLKNEHYSKDYPTHGQLVALGTLMIAYIFGEAIHDFRIYTALRYAYKKISLPLTYRELFSIGISKKHILRGLQSLVDEKCLLGNYYSKEGQKFLDIIFL